MKRLSAVRLVTFISAAGAMLAVPLFLPSNAAYADEGGVSFWLPGLFGSLAAAPQQPGWSLMTTYYNTTVSASGNVGFAREAEIGKVPINFSGTLNGNLNSNANLALVDPTYVFATPFFGGQAAVGLMGIYGGMDTTLNAALNGTITPPGMPISRSDGFNSALTGFGDLYPQFFLRWNAGVNNFMTYVTGDIPVGAYEFGAAFGYRNRSRRRRYRWRLHIFQPGHRARVFRGERAYLQFRKSGDKLSERGRLAHGLGRVAIHVQAIFIRRRRIFLQANRLR